MENTANADTRTDENTQPKTKANDTGQRPKKITGKKKGKEKKRMNKIKSYFEEKKKRCAPLKVGRGGVN